MDSASRVINFSIISIGEISNVRVSLAQLFKTALLSNASKLMIAHNHPTGVLEITSKDIEMTRKIAFFANAFSMELLDSVVVTSEDFISIRARCKEFLNDRKDSIQD
jgi:DNA repair protein RadC